jgi:CRISPR/Cas system CMR-associated protein Cmr5 small subunit
MTARRIDQGMAVAAARALPDAFDPELRSRYRQLRIMLHTAGLAATYAFIVSRGAGQDKLAKAYQAAGTGITNQLKASGLLETDGASPREILERIGKLKPVEYARASAEAAAFTGWLSRLADAEVQQSDDRG